VALRLHRERAPARILSAAELRLAEEIEERPIASAVVGSLPDGRDRLHRPDLVALEGERVLAIEVELSPKAPRRLLRIIRGWRRARHVDEVLYCCAPTITRRAVETAVRRARAEERIRVADLGDRLER
jgi:hypothetical protein